MVGPDIYRVHATTALLNPLPGILFQGKVAAKYFHKKVIGDTRAVCNPGIQGEGIQHFLFTACLQIYVLIIKDLFHPEQ